MIMNEAVISYLNYLAKTYDAVTQLIGDTKRRLGSLPGETVSENFDSMLKGEGKAEGLQTVQGRFLRWLEKELPQWDIWTLWLKKIPGIGPSIGAHLIIAWYYRFIPVCKECGGDLEKREKSKDNGKDEGKITRQFVCKSCSRVARDGILKFRIEIKDFPTISKWWAYMGRHTVDGVMPKRKKGVQANWSTKNRTLGFHIGDQFNRQKPDHPYRKFLDERKARHEIKDPKMKKGHRHNAGKNEAVKLFLAHFWTVARTIDEKPVSLPYAGAIMGHSDIIRPFYWDNQKTVETHEPNVSHEFLEI